MDENSHHGEHGRAEMKEKEQEKSTGSLRRLPPFSALRAFEAAGRRGNLSHAAEELYVTHGAISKQVKSLEEALGVTLTRRAGRGIQLTSNGRRLLPYLTKAFDDIYAALRSVSSETFDGDMVIACMPGLTNAWLIPRLPTFLNQYPNVSITVLPTSQLNNYHADIEIRYGRPEWPNRNITMLRQLDVFPVCSPRLMNGAYPVRRIDDLFKHTLIDEPDGSHWREFFVSQGKDPSKVTRTLRFQDFTHCITAARDGLGIAMGDDLTMASDLAAGRLIRPLLTQIRRQSLAYYLLTAPDQPLTGAMRAFIDWLT
ncbi:LysR substrate-binding domain-containing protein, partial [Blastomonas sp.]|uniref:LysR substrate-binding domain-containing protein n=1 Tax=Blastomonas sp. TaxID=1909299 RepID=UPI003593E1E7